MKLLRQVDALFNKIEGALLITLLLVMMVMAFLQVVLRNVFSSGIIWADILLRHLVLWISFLGAALATSIERHISIDALTRFLSHKARHISKVITNLFAAVICYFMMKASITFVGYEISDGHTVYGQIPSWYAQIIIPVGFGLLAFHFLVRVAANAAAAFSKESA